MDLPFSLILDILVAVLLVVTISYAVTLNKRLGTLRSDKAELRQLALNFAEATTRAEDSTSELRATTEVLKAQIGKAESLREDLVFLVDRGNGTADRLEELVRTARDEAGVSPKPNLPSRPVQVDGEPANGRMVGAEKPQSRREAPTPNADERADSGAESDAERELLKALRSAG